jgi:deoxyribodipyrimidine photo-lyase
MTIFIPTRAAGLARLSDFTPRMGRGYALGRNTDRGDGPQDVSTLSPYLRRRLVTEAETFAAAMDAHGELAESFVTQVAWRGYFKGWLEQHPSVWDDYLMQARAGDNRLATEGGLRRVYHDACEGRTGIDCFDHWACELVATGWLHNHARMWFASIWIFTLRLPWALGAAFFLRHLRDGDPASNTLSWRWVAGLHTRGKHYLARAENIARFTEGRFNPVGQLDEAAGCLEESRDHPLERLVAGDEMPAGRFSLLLHDEDTCPASVDPRLFDAEAVAVFSAVEGAAGVVDFVSGAVDDMIARLGRPVARLQPGDVAGWVRAQGLPVVTPWAPVGPTAAIIRDLDLVRIRRKWDNAIWPHATKGFFQLRRLLPGLLAEAA